MLFRRSRSRLPAAEKMKECAPQTTTTMSLHEKKAVVAGPSSNNNNNLKVFFRLLNGASQRRHQRKGAAVVGKRKVVVQAAASGGGGRTAGVMRKSTSTYLTERTNRSSAFLIDPLVEPMTMEDFLLAEERATFEETKQEIAADYLDEMAATTSAGTADADAPRAEVTAASATAAAGRLLHRRFPAPESYYEMAKNDHPELGKIQFEFETLEEAQEESLRRQCPILCIEAQIPGDVTTGNTVFSHPLIVEAAESLFVTVKPRPLQPQEDDDNYDDRQRFFTNSSCRTRVRILDDMGIDVLPPVEHTSAVEVVAALVRGLESYRKAIPKYLRLLLEEESGKLQVLSKTRFREIQGKAVFGMFDSVLAEVEFAGLDGVLSTRSGSLMRQQVVCVTYDSRRLSYSALAKHALQRVKANVIYYETNDERIAAQLQVQRFNESRNMLHKMYGKKKNNNGGEGEEESSLFSIKVTEFFGNMRASHKPAKPALRGSVLRFVPLTDLQATKANRLISLQKFNEAMHLLSPRQGLIAMQSLQAHHSRDFQDVVDVPIGTAWNGLCCTDAAAGPVAEAGIQWFEDSSSDCPTEDPTEEYEDPFFQ